LHFWNAPSGRYRQIQTGFRPLARHNAKDRPEGSLFAVIGEIRLREVLKPDGVGDTP
jgi:hypothetical protein